MRLSFPPSDQVWGRGWPAAGATTGSLKIAIGPNPVSTILTDGDAPRHAALSRKQKGRYSGSSITSRQNTGAVAQPDQPTRIL